MSSKSAEITGFSDSAAAIFEIVRVISITTYAKGETDAEAVMPAEQTEQKKAIAAIIGIVVVAVAAIIVIVIALI